MISVQIWRPLADAATDLATTNTLSVPMNRMRLPILSICLVAGILVSVLAVADVAIAQPTDPNAPPSMDEGFQAPAWVLPYGVIILTVGASMFVVCSSARRRERGKPESYTQKHELGEKADATGTSE